MKNTKYIILLILATSTLLSQEQWELDMIEEECKYHFDTGTQLFNVSQYIIEFDYKIEHLDTSTIEGKIERNILKRHKQQILQDALYEFDNILEYYPTCSVLNKTVYNKAQIHFELGQIDSARIYYLKLTNSEIPSELDTSEITDIYDERYFNYKNSSYRRLAELEYQQGNYTKSIEYLNYSSEIGYNHFCGNEHASNSKNMAISYAKNYYAIDSLDKAINLLLPHILKNGLTRNKEPVTIAIDYLLEKYSREFLISELEDGFKNFIKKKPRANSKYNKYYINFLNAELELALYEKENSEEEQKALQNALEKELIYIKLKESKPTHNKR